MPAPPKTFTVAGGPGVLPDALPAALAGDAAPVSCLINADLVADASTVVGRCHAFADEVLPDEEALIVTLLHAAPPGLAQWSTHAANAALWAFTQQAALDWAPRRIRVNAIGLGASPAGPFEATEQSGRNAAAMPAVPASLTDIARTIRAIAAWPSMTGQIVRLGA